MGAACLPLCLPPIPGKMRSQDSVEKKSITHTLEDIICLGRQGDWRRKLNNFCHTKLQRDMETGRHATWGGFPYMPPLTFGKILFCTHNITNSGVFREASSKLDT